jgi:integrase
MSQLAHGEHVRKVCGCGWRQWPKCPHPWHFSYKPRGGPRYRFSFDAEFGGHIESKTDAEKKAANIRSEIDAGTFERSADRRAREQREAAERLEREAKESVLAGGAAVAPVTIEQLGTAYFSEYVNEKTGEPLSPNERIKWDLAMRTEIQRTNGVRVLFGSLPVNAITRHDLDAFRQAHFDKRLVTIKNSKGHTYTALRGGKAGVRGCLSRVRAFYGWAVDKDHVESTPFRKGGNAVKGLFVHEPGRERRLSPGEWDKLFAAANPHLQALMVAAIETTCRVGELLSLTWQQVRFDLNEIHLRAEDTKARRKRHLPMSQRLSALLEMRRLDPEGQPWPPTAYVFGDEATGERVKSVKTAWETARLKAHGFKVKRERNGRLTPECRQHLRAINLRFHDLRREAGSRFLEGGMAANYVQKFLDHAKLSTTSRYLNIERTGMHAALKGFEKQRRTQEQRAARGKVVANGQPAGAHPKIGRSDKSVQ